MTLFLPSPPSCETRPLRFSSAPSFGFGGVQEGLKAAESLEAKMELFDKRSPPLGFRVQGSGFRV